MTTNNSGATVRKVLGRSQKDFAEQCGLDRTYFGGVERGERNLTFFSLCEICAGLTVRNSSIESRSEVAGIRATLYRIN